MTSSQTEILAKPEGIAHSILETESLTRRFESLTAVDELTVSIQAGEMFGLVGPNGAGKTTVIKMLTTLLPPRLEMVGLQVMTSSNMRCM
jgi:ABC-2 type transport system ATP-binding protein